MKALLNTTVGDLAVICGGRLEHGDPAMAVTSLTTDSRESGPSSVYIPIKGQRFNGHDFIKELCFSGSAAVCLTSEDICFEYENRSTAIISCADTMRALSDIAFAHRRALPPFVIGITGTNGKTTTKELIAAVISSKYSCVKSEKNYNNEIGVPFTLLGIGAGHEYAVIEMGMNHSGEISRLSRMAQPDMTVITSVGEGHLEFLKSVENVARAKAEIFNGAMPGSTAIINRDTKCWNILAERASRAGMKVLTYGLAEGAVFRPSAWSLAEDSLTITIENTEIKVPLFGIHNVYNSLAAVCAGMACGIELSQIKGALENFSNIGGRGSAIDKGYLVIDDTYNANPLSLKAALESAAEVYKNRRRVAALGDMMELGENAAALHRDSGRLAAESGISELCLCGKMAEQYRAGAIAGGMAGSAVKVFSGRTELGQYLLKSLKTGDLVLVKGSRSAGMEEIVKMLTGDK